MSGVVRPNIGHGWVVPRPDGAKSRCGGPALCMSCQAEALMLAAKTQASSPPMTHPQTQDDEALVEVMARAIGQSARKNHNHWLPFGETLQLATAALTALRNHEGRK